MRLPLGPEFRDEWQRCSFRFYCEACAHYVARDGSCAHAWPQAEHRLGYYLDERCRELVFCKEFELW
jgi:hypothetical protein